MVARTNRHITDGSFCFVFIGAATFVEAMVVVAMAKTVPQGGLRPERRHTHTEAPTVALEALNSRPNMCCARRAIVGSRK